MHSILHILNTSTELMSAVELMSGAKSRKWVHQKPTNQPTNYRVNLINLVYIFGAKVLQFVTLKLKLF